MSLKPILIRAVQRVAAALIAQVVITPLSWGAEFDTGNPDISLRWDNTLKYSTAWRLQGASSTLINDNPTANINNLNLDDGDRNFNRGLISNRVDVLSELDFNYKRAYGGRVSWAGWYDLVYNTSNENDAPPRVNSVTVPYNQFTSGTRNLHGRRQEVLDAYAYANGDRWNVRAGQYALLYGETLFFGANGIANAQSPVDLVKLLSVPNSTFKEIILPVPQLSGQFQILDNLTLGGYYQFRWDKTRVPGAGSYFSNADVFDDGAERFLFAPGFGPLRANDLQPKNSGQGGVQLRWRPTGTDWEFGFYAAKYSDKLFQAYLRPVGASVPGFPFNYQLVYPEGIKTYGASFSTSLGDFNVAGEASVRRNTPLVSGPQVDTSPAGACGINENACYAVGNSAHFNLSTIYLLKATPLWEGGSFIGELAWNRYTSITKNPDALDPNTSKDGWAMRFVFSPTWFQVFPGLDLSAPIGLGYNPRGNSSVVQVFNGGTKNGGDLSLGLEGVYEQVWFVGLNYTHFFGSEGPALYADGHLSFKQSLGDRDYISFSLRRTF